MIEIVYGDGDTLIIPLKRTAGQISALFVTLIATVCTPFLHQSHRSSCSEKQTGCRKEARLDSVSLCVVTYS